MKVKYLLLTIILVVSFQSYSNAQNVSNNLLKTGFGLSSKKTIDTLIRFTHDTCLVSSVANNSASLLMSICVDDAITFGDIGIQGVSTFITIRDVNTGLIIPLLVAIKKSSNLYMQKDSLEVGFIHYPIVNNNYWQLDTKLNFVNPTILGYDCIQIEFSLYKKDFSGRKYHITKEVVWQGKMCHSNNSECFNFQAPQYISTELDRKGKVKSINNAEIIISPNPIEQSIQVHFPEPFELTSIGESVKIFDLMGNLLTQIPVSQTSILENSLIINLNQYNLTEGIYFLRFYYKSSLISRRIMRL